MILAMVRHGQTFYNSNGIVQGRVNIPLNENGRKQARNLAQLLIDKNESFDIIASSPLSRAVETAYIISKKFKYNKPLMINHYFIERDFFHLDGKPVEEAMPQTREKGYTYEGYENDELLIERVKNATLRLAEKYSNQKILLVAHSHVIKALRIYANPEKYAFTDIIDNTDIIYFEIIGKNIILL